MLALTLILFNLEKKTKQVIFLFILITYNLSEQ